MPFATIADLPADQTQGLNDVQKRAFLEAFNDAVYRDGKTESEAFKIAHAAAKRAGGSAPAKGEQGGKKKSPKKRKRSAPPPPAPSSAAPPSAPALRGAMMGGASY